MLDHDYMYKHSWTYRETVDRGIAEGLARGRAEALAEALAGERRVVLAIAQARFPQLVSLATEMLEQINDSELLQEITIKLSTLQELGMVELYLLGLKQGRGIS